MDQASILSTLFFFHHLLKRLIGDYVGIGIFAENPYGVLIKDKNVVEGYRKQFEILWNNAKS